MKHSIPDTLALALMVSACNQQAPATVVAAEAPVARAEPSLVSAEHSPTPSARPSGEDLAAPALVRNAEKGEEGARNLLLEWARAIERRDFARADAHWGPGAADAKSAARFADYRTITLEFGDGEVEGGAGSLYYEAPLTITGTLKNGVVVTRHGSLVVRRVNGVDGATPAQLRWHVSGVTLTR